MADKLLGGTGADAHQYAFQIEVRNMNKEYYGPTAHTSWKLWLADSQDYVVDGTPETLYFHTDPKTVLPIAEEVDKGFGVYQDDLITMTELGVVVKSTLPSAIAGALDTVLEDGDYISFDGLKVSTDNLMTDVRFTLPNGFNVDLTTFLAYPEGQSWRDDHWPTGTCRDNMVAAHNKMEFPGCTFSAHVKYGFSIKAIIPPYSKTNCVNMFYIELGYKGTSLDGTTQNTRLGAKALEAPIVRTIRNFRIDYSSNQVATSNYLTVEFFLVTPLTDADQGIVIAGQEANANFIFVCFQEVFFEAEGYNRLPSDYGCQFSAQRYHLFVQLA